MARFTLQNSLGQVVLMGDNLLKTLDLQAFTRGKLVKNGG